MPPRLEKVKVPFQIRLSAHNLLKTQDKEGEALVNFTYPFVRLRQQRLPAPYLSGPWCIGGMSSQSCPDQPVMIFPFAYKWGALMNEKSTHPVVVRSTLTRNVKNGVGHETNLVNRRDNALCKLSSICRRCRSVRQCRSARFLWPY